MQGGAEGPDEEAAGAAAGGEGEAGDDEGAIRLDARAGREVGEAGGTADVVNLNQAVAGGGAEDVGGVGAGGERGDDGGVATTRLQDKGADGGEDRGVGGGPIFVGGDLW